MQVKSQKYDETEEHKNRRASMQVKRMKYEVRSMEGDETKEHKNK